MVPEAENAGYRVGYGPGTTTDQYSGGSYGGRGGDDGLDGGVGKAYGNIHAPGNIGSGAINHPGSSYGAGVIIITVNGEMVVDGDVAASAATATAGAGSGGSVYLTSTALSGSGNIRVNGGACNGWGGGGGGRIAVYLTGAGNDFSQFSGQMTAYGGDTSGVNEDGAAGTIYRQTLAQGSGNGELILDNNNLSTYVVNGVVTHITPLVSGRNFGDVLIRNRATLLIDDTSVDLTISGNWVNTASQSLRAGNVVFAGNAPEIIRSSGGNFLNLEFAGRGGSWICADDFRVYENVIFTDGMLDGNAELVDFRGDMTFSGGNFQTGTDIVLMGNAAGNAIAMNSGNLYINSDAPDSDILINAGTFARSGGVIWYTGGSSTSLFNSLSSYAGLGVNAPGSTLSATGNIDVNGGFTLSAGVVSLGANTLFIAGDVSVSGGSLSCPGGNVVFDGDLTYSDSTGSFAIPDLFIGQSPDTTTLGSNMLVGNLTINAGDRFIAAGYDLTVLGNLVCYGNLDASTGTSVISVAGDWVMGNLFVAGGSNIVLNGTAAQSFTAGGAAGNALNTLTVANSDAQVSFADGFSAGNLHCVTPGASLVFAAGASYTVTGNLSVTGSEAAVVSLDSSDGATPFEIINQTGSTQNLRYTWVGNSQATTGDIYAANSKNLGGNDDEDASPHWIFMLATTYTWTGGGDGTTWELATNWNVGTGWPDDPNDIAVIAATADAITTSGNFTIGELQMNTGFTGSLSLDGNLTLNALQAGNGSALIYAGTLKHPPNGITQQYRLIMLAGGDFVLGAAASINVDGLGFNADYGPGKPSASSADGGGYGGIGGDNNRNATTSTCYGSVTSPGNLGSGGDETSGGGAVIISAGGALALNGTIRAGGVVAANGAGSGGSVFLSGASISGSGNISALGGAGGAKGAGGGGRVALVLSAEGADFSGFSGTLSAVGGDSSGTYVDGAAGTIYLQSGSQASGQGNLIIDNDDRSCFGGVSTLMPPGTAIDNFTEIIIRDQGNLGVGSGSSLDFSNALISGESRDSAQVSIVDAGGVSFPFSFTVSGYTLALDTPLSASGNWIISSNGALSHSRNAYSQIYTMDLTLDGNLEVNAGGRLHADGMGFYNGAGPGDASDSYDGGGHGGRGGEYDYDGGVGSVNGNIIAPNSIGSGGSGFGYKYAGGAIKLTVSGNFIVDGDTSANGESSGDGSGSGGSIWVTAGALSGSGNIRANGGVGSRGAGGGGRVAVILSGGGSDFSGYVGLLAAYGGDSGALYSDGAAGTVYLQTAAQAAGQGNLVIDNNNLSCFSGVYTDMPYAVDFNQFSEVVIRNKGNLAITDDDSFDFSSVTLNCNGRNESFITVAGSDGVNFPFTYSIASYTLILDDVLSAAGNWTVTSSGGLSPSMNYGSAVYSLDLSLDGNFYLDQGGIFNADQKGYYQQKGPGFSNTAPSYDGGAHLGMGGDDSENGRTGTTYGNITGPVTLGSGGYSYWKKHGGGVLKISVSGNLVMNDDITADAVTDSDGAAAGGSVWINAGALSGSGNIRANGGDAGSRGGGGGGIVAVYLTGPGADFSTHSGEFSANGGNGSGAGEDAAAGTVYRQIAAQGAGNGELIIDNPVGRDVYLPSKVATYIHTNITGLDVGDVLIRNAGILLIDQAALAFTCSGNWVNTATQVISDGTITFDGNAAEIIRSGGGNFHNLIFNGRGGAWTCADALTLNGNVAFRDGLLDGNAERVDLRGDMTFSGGNFQTGTGIVLMGNAAGNAITMNSGNLYINSDAPDSDIVINAGTFARNGGVIHYTGGPSTTLFNSLSSYAGLGVNAPGSILTATGNIDVNDTFALAAGTISLGAYTLFIAGDVSVSGGSISCPGGNVVFDGDLRYTDASGSFAIPDLFIGGSPDTTTLGSNMLVGNLTINAGDRFIAAGYDLTVLGNLVCYGNLDASAGTSVISVAGDWVMGNLFVSGGSNIVLNGSAAQSFTAGGAAGNALNTLTLANSTAQVSFTDGFSAGNLHCFTPGANLSFVAGGTYTVTGNVSLEGSTTAVIYVNSSTGASRFELDNQTGSVQTVRYLHMGNSEVSTTDMYAFGTRNEGGTDAEEVSPHWIFIDPTTYTWSGNGDGTTWESAANWNIGDATPGDDGYPDDPTDRALLDSTSDNVTTAWPGNTRIGELSMLAGFSGNLEPGGNLIVSNLLNCNGNLTINAGNLRHRDNSTTAAPIYKLNVTVSNDLTIGNGGSINVDARGYDADNGPGAPTTFRDGGSYGGIGGDNAKDGTDAVIYGNIFAPVDLGSGADGGASGMSGGGAIGLSVAGDLVVEGPISAQGGIATGGSSGGSGGSVFITAGTISGSAGIRADGGGSGWAGTGGGGRIGVILTSAGADFSSFGGTISSVGGDATSGDGAAGTIYLETLAQGAGAGNLFVDNDNRDVIVAWVTTPLPAGTILHDLSDVILRDDGRLEVDDSITLDFSQATIHGESQTEGWLVVRGNAGISFPENFTLDSGYALVLDIPITVSGNWTIGSTGRIAHSPNYNSETYKLDLTLAGNLTVSAGANINADAAGYYRDNGPGKPANGSSDGGGYGGIGGDNAADGTTASAYGNIRVPVNLGSGGDDQFGGGAIRLNISGDTVVNGAISVKGGGGSTGHKSGSGGSVYLTTKSLSGSGSIAANGGDSGWGGAGGGGRVAVYLTDASDDFSSFDGLITAYGGDATNGDPIKDGAAGTVYLETIAQGSGNGELTIDNPTGRKTSTVTGVVTPIHSGITGTDVGDLRLENTTYLVISDVATTLTVSGNWTNNATQVITAGNIS
ncbi:MAG: hypothetical protein HQL31_03445 [Planctomycetes bacterium]|nr:hypothetical protein [Planctomycetota bacterium]